jgi:quinoprotein glucose dehydrogenase
VVGGNLGNTRYSSLDQVNTGNVSGLKAAWMIHLGSGLSTGTPPYTLEATPVVQDGVMYMSTGSYNRKLWIWVEVRSAAYPPGC